MDRLVQSAGALSRHFLPHGPGDAYRKIAAKAFQRLAPGRDLRYCDQWGYQRRAVLRHFIEAFAFAGVATLPSRVMAPVRPGDWVIDVGANVGMATAQLCHRVGPAGRVWAVEPVPGNVARLEELKAWNSLEQLRIFAGVVSSAAGTLALRVPEDELTASIDPVYSVNPIRRIVDVPAWRLDDLVFADADGRRVALVKIDVEAHERQVLDGAERTLDEMRPAVFCEFNDVILRTIGSSAAELLERFRQLGYVPAGGAPRLEGRILDLLMVARRP